jgi:hypothetical protein
VRLRVDDDHLGPAPVELLGQAKGRVKPDVTCPYDNDALRIHASIIALASRLSADM